jgi:hypothetical protein
MFRLDRPIGNAPLVIAFHWMGRHSLDISHESIPLVSSPFRDRRDSIVRDIILSHVHTSEWAASEPSVAYTRLETQAVDV